MDSGFLGSMKALWRVILRTVSKKPLKSHRRSIPADSRLTFTLQSTVLPRGKFVGSYPFLKKWEIIGLQRRQQSFWTISPSVRDKKLFLHLKEDRNCSEVCYISREGTYMILFFFLLQLFFTSGISLRYHTGLVSVDS